MSKGKGKDKKRVKGLDLYGVKSESAHGVVRALTKGVKHGAIPSCHETHPALVLGGGTVLGGSCRYPARGYDVYVGLDHTMSLSAGSGYPWAADYHAAEKVHFVIPDGGVPSSAKDFRALVDWLVVQLAAGKRVHVGCIGGHGRTGMLLSALVKVVTGEVDACEWVRKHYCASAVETSVQVEFLHAHYGIKRSGPSKSLLWGADYGGPSYAGVTAVSGSPSLRSFITPIAGKTLWGDDVKLIDKR